MILNWTNGDIVTLRAATAPLSATSLLAYSSTLPAVKKHLLDWKLQLSTPTPAVAAAPNLRQIGMDFENGRFRSVVVCCFILDCCFIFGVEGNSVTEGGGLGV